MSSLAEGVSVTVAVTGHRDIGPPYSDAVTTAVEWIFERLAADIPMTRLTLLSALAEGADRLVAHIAMRRGASLVACLPFVISEYEKDFRDESSRAEYRMLLAQSLRVVVAPATEVGVPAATGRSAHYAAVGAFLVRRAQILIALWDGRETGRSGGTAEVVRWMLEGISGRVKPTRSLNGLGDCPFVCHVMTRRASNPVDDARGGLLPGQVRILLGKGSHRCLEAPSAPAIWRDVGGFNRAVATSAAPTGKM